MASRQTGTNQLRSNFDRLHASLTGAVAACRVQAGKHQVHGLRTGIRKLEALLRKALEDHPAAAEFHKVARKAQRELKSIRKAAGPVRDLDVHRELAGELQEQPAPASEQAKHGQLPREIRKLDRDLKQRRKQAAAALQKLLKRREVRLEQRLEQTAAAMASISAASPAPLVTAAKWARIISVHKPDPSTSSFQDDLHGYRKQTKAARYVASLQKTSDNAQRLAERLKQTQDCIGRWHDLMLLSDEAARLLGKRSALAALLRGQRNSALQTATESLPDGPGHVSLPNPSRQPMHDARAPR